MKTAQYKRGDKVWSGSKMWEITIADSVQEFIDHALGRAESSPRSENEMDRHIGEHVTRRRNRDWTGREDLRSWDRVAEAAGGLWEEGVETVHKMIKELENASIPKPKSRRRRKRFSEDDGQEIDIDRLRSGQTFWRETYRETTTGPNTITLLVDVGANCHKKSGDILWRGASAVALTHLLENAGYRVELWAYWSVSRLYRDKTGATFSYCLKEASQPVNISSFANAVSGWFFRSILFAATAQHTDKKVPTSFLGSHAKIDPKEIKMITPDEKAINIRDAWTYDSAVERIRGYLATLGVSKAGK